MHKVGSRKLKNRLGHYLARVRRGESLVVTDRGEPVARVIPAGAQASAADTVEAILQAEAASGRIRLAKRSLAAFTPVKAKGKSASQIILEDRR
jgi:prevent-host-death family protein